MTVKWLTVPKVLNRYFVGVFYDSALRHLQIFDDQDGLLQDRPNIPNQSEDDPISIGLAVTYNLKMRQKELWQPRP